MAVSDLLPRKSMGSKSRRQTLHDRLDYDQKKEKTKDGELVSSYMCSPETVARSETAIRIPPFSILHFTIYNPMPVLHVWEQNVKLSSGRAVRYNLFHSRRAADCLQSPGCVGKG